MASASHLTSMLLFPTADQARLLKYARPRCCTSKQPSGTGHSNEGGRPTTASSSSLASAKPPLRLGHSTER